jgi:hypothetical protein
VALYAFDGTWNEDEPGFEMDTNVLKFCNAYLKDKNYIEGVGTRFSLFGKILGGATGAGGQQRIREMYKEACQNYKDGDKEIDIIGFSRGSALALQFCHVLAEKGLELNSGETEKPKVRFLGLWDTVSSFGVPINFIIPFQEINLGYDLTVPDNVERCYHAMALNERRQTFMITRLDPQNTNNKIEERWFRGVHTDVGGGNENIQLSKISLLWMLEKAKENDVIVSTEAIATLTAETDPPQTDVTIPIGRNPDLIKNKPRTIMPNDLFHPTAWGKELEIGESESFNVHASEPYSWTGVRLIKGGKYIFKIPPNQIWEDGSAKCGPEGWTVEDQNFTLAKSNIIRISEGKRRHNEANWFEVIGTIEENDEYMFRIGNGSKSEKPYVSPQSGGLFTFANDLEIMYWNNKGFVKIVIERVG